MSQRPPHDPAHYWRLASEMMEQEQWARLRAMKDTDGLQTLIRLTKGSRIGRDDRIQKESELVLVSELFRLAYSHPKDSLA